MAEIPDFVAARDHTRDELVRFVRSLRRVGVAVPVNAGTTAARALVEVGFADRERARVALRACLTTEHTDRKTFNDLFSEFWRRLTAGLDASGPAERPENGPDGGLAPLGAEAVPGERAESSAAGTEENEQDEADGGEERSGLGAVVGRETVTAEGEEVTTAQYSPTGQRTAVSVPTVAGENGFEGAFSDLTRALAGLSGRRWGSGNDAPDARRALRASIGTGGTVIDVPRRERQRTAVRARLLVDVSQSVLDVLDRSFLIRFLQRARTAWRDARVFFFDDNLREVTQSFDAEDSRAALDALERAEAEWGGGTRIGGALSRLRTDFPHSVDRRSVVLLVSDGLEMGDISALETELSSLSRTAGAVCWLNPLAASVEYEPTARGMAAALPYLDGLFAFAGPEDLTEIARQLRRQGIHGRIGYEYDTRRESV